MEYFKKSENKIGAGKKAKQFHGTNGPLIVSTYDPDAPQAKPCNVTTPYWVKGAVEVGIPYNEDYNGEEQVCNWIL